MVICDEKGGAILQKRQEKKKIKQEFWESRKMEKEIYKEEKSGSPAGNRSCERIADLPESTESRKDPIGFADRNVPIFGKTKGEKS